MLIAMLVIVLLIWAQNTVIGYKTVYEYETEPKIRDFASLDDAMEYAELRRTGWSGDIDDFYKWKEEE